MFKFSETNHVHKIFLPTTSALLMIYGEVGQGVKTSQERRVRKESRKWEYPLAEYDMG